MENLNKRAADNARLLGIIKYMDGCLLLENFTRFIEGYNIVSNTNYTVRYRVVNSKGVMHTTSIKPYTIYVDIKDAAVIPVDSYTVEYRGGTVYNLTVT
jgi:hypothetical protein